MDGKTVVRTENAPAPFQGAPYSQAIKANGLVFVAGQLGLAPGGTEVVGPGIEEQTRQTFDNLEAILTEAGSGLDRIVKTTVFLASLDDFQGMSGREPARAVDDRGGRPPVRRARRDRGNRPRLTLSAMADEATWPVVPEDLLPDAIVSAKGAHVCRGTAPEAFH
jgi:2-iminobutanoate/2-iminopropanoate deaminase